jgi:serine kinase of HPr protein (carbohydrate metabolism regulator)
MTGAEVLHAGLVARRVDGIWRGVLIEGPSGCGKSDLILRALGLGWRLVADDRVVVWRSSGAAWGRAPLVLAGLLEARAVGVTGQAERALCRIDLVISHAERPERMPEDRRRDIAGTPVPTLQLNLAELSAAPKLALALARALQGDAASQLGAGDA